MSELASLAGFSSDATYHISRYEIKGNTTLEPEIARNLFTNAIGPAVSLGCICRALAALRQAYQERGDVGVTVALPEQQLTNGVVLIEVTEGAAHRRQSAGILQATGPPTARPSHPTPTRFEIRRFEVTGDTLLGSREIERILTPATGSSVSLDEVRLAAAALQRAYRDRGFVTVAVTVPSQRLTNATVRLEVTEGKLVAVQVVGNRHFSSNNIVRALPSLHTNTLLNSHILQRELDLANQNRDRQIYPMIGPGPHRALPKCASTWPRNITTFGSASTSWEWLTPFRRRN
jgi:hemolysin activation/secretion protein